MITVDFVSYGEPSTEYSISTSTPSIESYSKIAFYFKNKRLFVHIGDEVIFRSANTSDDFSFYLHQEKANSHSRDGIQVQAEIIDYANKPTSHAQKQLFQSKNQCSISDNVTLSFLYNNGHLRVFVDHDVDKGEKIVDTHVTEEFVIRMTNQNLKGPTT